jgi:dephospho-CoA kinase
MHMQQKVLGIVGMPGSGKSEAAMIGRDYGFNIVVMGDVIRNEVARRHLEPDPENVGRIMLELRQLHGPSIVAQLCLQHIAEAGYDQIIIEGIRSMAEVTEFKTQFPQFTILAIHSSPSTRLQRILNRGRSDDANAHQFFIDRDQRELHVGIGSVIALADYVVINEGILPEFHNQIHQFFKAQVHGL